MRQKDRITTVAFLCLLFVVSMFSSTQASSQTTNSDSGLPGEVIQVSLANVPACTPPPNLPPTAELAVFDFVSPTTGSVVAQTDGLYTVKAGDHEFTIPPPATLPKGTFNLDVGCYLDGLFEGQADIAQGFKVGGVITLDSSSCPLYFDGTFSSATSTCTVDGPSTVGGSKSIFIPADYVLAFLNGLKTGSKVNFVVAGTLDISPVPSDASGQVVVPGGIVVTSTGSLNVNPTSPDQSIDLTGMLTNYIGGIVNFDSGHITLGSVVNSGTTDFLPEVSAFLDDSYLQGYTYFSGTNYILDPIINGTVDIDSGAQAYFYGPTFVWPSGELANLGSLNVYANITNSGLFFLQYSSNTTVFSSVNTTGSGSVIVHTPSNLDLSCNGMFLPSLSSSDNAVPAPCTTPKVKTPPTACTGSCAVNGTSEADANVAVYECASSVVHCTTKTATMIGETTAGVTGTWALDVSPPSSGTFTFFVQAQGVDGDSHASHSFSVSYTT